MEGTPGTPLAPLAFCLEEAPKLCQKQVGGSCPQWQSTCRDEHAEDPAAAYVEWQSKKTLNLCRFFAKGRCAKGAACTYLHVKTCPRNRGGAPVKGAIKTQAEIDSKPSKERTKGKETQTVRGPSDGQPARPGQSKDASGPEPPLPPRSAAKIRAPGNKAAIEPDPMLREVKRTRGKIRALLCVQQSLGDIAKHVGGDIQSKKEHADAIVEKLRTRLAELNQWIDEETQSIGFKAAPDEGINDASDDSA